jgi:ribosome-associated heat shock protein Hsp15
MKATVKDTDKKDTLRLDTWLWRARFGKTRAITQRLCLERRMRVNGQVVTKSHHALRPGDVLTFPLHHRVVVVRVIDLGLRRGPAAEARALYEDLSPADAAAVGHGCLDAVKGPREVAVERRSVL